MHHKHYLSQYGQRDFGEFAIFLSLPQCNIPIPCNSIVEGYHDVRGGLSLRNVEGAE